MNENNFNQDQFNNEQPIIEMTPEERKSHKRTFSKLCFAFVAYLAVIEVLIVLVSFICKSLPSNPLLDPNYSLLISSALQYAIAFPILALIIRTIPKHAPTKNKLSAKSFIKYLFVSMFTMYVGNYISVILMSYIAQLLGNAPENAVDTILNETNVILSILIVGIIGPIIEELMFRKLFIDRLVPYGEIIAVFFPSFIFGLFHGNLYQFFYAFFIGSVFSYIYVKTGKIIYSTLLHIFINLFCGVLPATVLSKLDLDQLLEMALEGNIPEEYIMANAVPLAIFTIYEFIMLGLVGAGIFTFTRNLRNIKFEKAEVKLPKEHVAEIIFGNVGTIALVALCVLMMAISTFTF